MINKAESESDVTITGTVGKDVKAGDGVFRFHLGVNIAVLGQFGTRNVHVPGLAVSVHGGRVVLAVHGHSDGVTGLDVFTHGTGDGQPYR
ncbi:hypothetical protein D0C27_19260 [Alcaligenes faecalis]|nr:hypothetical protein D0C27_19260 [Alcaligenes faecalis]